METKQIGAFSLTTVLMSVFILSVFCGFSQGSYTRKELKEFRSLNDICNCIPENATRVSYVVLGKVGEKIEQFNGLGDTLNADVRLLLNTANLGSKIFMDVKYATRESAMLKVNAFSFKVTK